MDNSRRGLPPPPAMSLAPEPGLPAVSQLPPPPPQWHNSEESMRQWLQAKAEEDRRRQEEERTRQESLRLEQRKIEQSMLRDSLQAGVPPHMVPLIFAGLGGGNLPRATVDTIQQLVDQTSTQSQPPQHQRPPPPPPPPPSSQVPPPPSHTLPPEVRRDSRGIPPNPYGAQAGAPLPPAPAPPPPQGVPPSPTQQPYGQSQQPLLHPPPADPRAPPSTLSRINTTDIHIQHPPPNVGAGQYQPGAAAPPPPAASVKPETQQQQSPSIYFHHWVPPGQSQPTTPSGRSQQESTPSSHSHLRSEFQSSPGRKRKAQGSHPLPPPPSSQPSEPSQSPRHATPARRGPGQGHLRQQSDTSYESRYQEVQESDQESAHRQARSGQSIINPAPPTSERGPIRRSSGLGPETQPVSEGREQHPVSAPSAPQSRYEELQTSQPGGYGGYPSHDSSRQ